ncbi:MOSC domain-containing protein [Aureimonas sp. AU4]|uniref:MOSC domain-containing protein n=1 Tax=Aureimonas sp. AU4 TaxID=1638163 RepID=UPI00078214D4|nr:MOSC domain-containing protein [Aureimonas sp. AU4]
MPRVASLHIHPVKGARGIALDRTTLDLEGLAGDRRWMLVDEAGRFVSQREMPELALLDAQPDPDGLHLSLPEGGERFVATPDGGARLTVRVWGDEVEAAAASPEDDAAVSRWFGRSLRLVHFDAGSRRLVSRDWLERDAPVGFADGFPLLIATQESLRGLNREIVAAGGEAVPMSRFRPNLVLSGAEPFADDGWATIRVGDVLFDLVKPCARCIVTTTDQDTGARDGPEPLATLARLRRSADGRAPGALFGWNAVPRSGGRLAVGDAVEVVTERPGGWPLR